MGKTLTSWRTGVQSVVQRQLGLQGVVPVDVSGVIVPTIELRSLRSWEESDEGIIRWALDVNVAAVAAQQSGVTFAGPYPAREVSAGDPLTPPGSLLVIDELYNYSANSVDIVLNPAGFVGANVSARAIDNRQGDSLGGTPFIAQGYASAALGGVRIGRVNGGGGLMQGLGIIQVQSPTAQQRVGLFVGTVNVQALMVVRGRLVLGS